MGELLVFKRDDEEEPEATVLVDDAPADEVLLHELGATDQGTGLEVTAAERNWALWDRSVDAVIHVLLSIPNGFVRVGGLLSAWVSMEGHWEEHRQFANGNVGVNAQKTPVEERKDLERDQSIRYLIASIGGIVFVVAGWLLAKAGLRSVDSVTTAARFVGLTAITLVWFGWFGRDKSRPLIQSITVNVNDPVIRLDLLQEAVAAALPGSNDAGDVIVTRGPIHRDGIGVVAQLRLPGVATREQFAKNIGGVANRMGWDPHRVKIQSVYGSPEVVVMFLDHDPEDKSDIETPIHPVLADIRGRGRTDSFVAAPIGYEVDKVNQHIIPRVMNLFRRQVVIGGVPQQGKTTVVQGVVGHYVNDPRAVVILADFKDYGEYAELGPVCDLHLKRANRETYWRVHLVIQFLHDLMTGRSDLFENLPPHLRVRGGGLGEAAASDSDWGRFAFPILFAMEEVHALVKESPWWSEDEGLLEKLNRMGNGGGLTVLLTTQVFDSKLLPTALSNQYQQRICFHVPQWQAGKLIAGEYPESMKPTTFRPFEGVARNEQQFYKFETIPLEVDQLTEIASNARKLKSEHHPMASPTETLQQALQALMEIPVPPETGTSKPAAKIAPIDVSTSDSMRLAVDAVDAIGRLPKVSPRISWMRLTILLRDTFPDTWGKVSESAVASAVRDDLGVQSQPVGSKIDGTLRGCKVEDLRAVVAGGRS